MSQREQEPRSQAERRLVEGAVRALRAAAPAEWRELRFAFYATVGIDSASFTTVTADGTTQHAVPPGQVMRQMDKLRAEMYRPGKGAWFTALLAVERDGGYRVEFCYDDEPDFIPPLTPDAYAVDLDRFPRSPEHIPAWLGIKLREAAASGRGG